MAAKHEVRLRRIYDDVSKNDGTRVLVDRLWARGVSKERAHLNEWLKEVAPSTELRKWYQHDPDKFDEFTKKYLAELIDGEQREAFDHLKSLAKQGTLTLLTASKAVEISEAAVLRDALTG